MSAQLATWWRLARARIARRLAGRRVLRLRADLTAIEQHLVEGEAMHHRTACRLAEAHDAYRAAQLREDVLAGRAPERRVPTKVLPPKMAFPPWSNQ